jgi:hypothetical protein
MCHRWPNGDEYEGFFEAGRPHGRGGMAYADGREYAGDWVSGQPEGYGILRLPGGAGEYNGPFVAGQRHGPRGSLEVLESDGRTSTCVGTWADDALDGAGYQTWSDGARYDGNYAKVRWTEGTAGCRGLRGGWLAVAGCKDCGLNSVCYVYARVCFSVSCVSVSVSVSVSVCLSLVAVGTDITTVNHSPSG